MSFFFNQVIASNSTSNLGVSNSLISKELGKIDLFSSNFFGSHYSAWFNFAGLTFVSSTLVGFTSLGSDFDINFDNNLLLAPLSIFYSTLPTFPTSRFFSLGPPGIQANVSCFDHLVYPEPLLSYFKHLYFSCQVCFADNLLYFRRILPLSNLAMPCSSNSYLHHYISFVPSLQPYHNFINNYFILNGLQSSCLQLGSLGTASPPSFSLSEQVTIPSNLPYLEKQETTIQGGIFFQFSLPKLRLSSFPFALYISRPSSLVPHPSDSHPLESLGFNHSFYSQNLPPYVGFLGSHFTSIPSSIGDSASPVDHPIGDSIGNSSSSVGSLASNNLQSIRNLSSDNYGLSTCGIPSLHHFLNLRSRTASFFGFLDSFFLLDSPFLDSLPCLDLSSSDIFFSSNRSNSLLSNFNPLHQMSSRLGDAHFLFNNPLDKLLVSSSNASYKEHFLFNHHLFSINREHFCPYEEHFSSDEEHFLLAKEHLPLGEEHFLFNNSIFTSNTSFPVTPLASSRNPLLDEHFFVPYASLTVSNFCNFCNFNCFSSFSSFARLGTFSSFVSSYIHSPVFSFTHSLFNHMDIYHHLDTSKYCLPVNSSFSSLQSYSPHSCFQSQNISSAFILMVYNCVLAVQNPTSFFNSSLLNFVFMTQKSSSFFHFIAHNRVSKVKNAPTFFHFAYSNPVFETQNISTFFHFAYSNRVSKLPNAIFFSAFSSAFSCSNLINFLFLPSILSYLSRKNRSVLFNLASTLSFSSHKNKRDLLHCSSFLSAFVGKNSVHFLNSPSLKALLQKRSTSFSGSTSKQISNNLIKKANNLRSHYRIKMSFEAKVSSKLAISLARNYLLQQFPSAILLAACHQNTNHTHIHVLLFARDLDGKKLHFSNFNYKKLDIGWAKLYARVFGEHKLQQHIQKKAQSRNWKKDRVLGVERDKPHRISIHNRLDHSKNYADSYKNLSHLVDHYRPVNHLLNAYFVKSDLNNLANPDKNLVINSPFELNHISHFVKNLGFELKFLPLQPNHLAFNVDRNLANNLSTSLSSRSKSLSFDVRNLSFQPINFAFDIKNASNFDKSDPLNFSFSSHKDVFGSAKESVFWNSNLSFSDKQQVFLTKHPDFFGTQQLFFDKQQAFLTKQPHFFNTFFDHNLTFSHTFLYKQPSFFDNNLDFWNNRLVDFVSYSNSNAILDNKEHLHLLPSINFNLDHNQLFLDHKLPFWNNNPLDFAACSTFNSVLDNKELHHLQPSINLFDNFVEKHLAFNSSVIEKTSAFNTSFSDKDFLSNALIVDKNPSCNNVFNNVFVDKVVDKYIVSNRLDFDKVAPIDKDLAHHQPSHNLTHHHDLKLNQTHNLFNYHHYLDLIDTFETDYLHCLSERVLLEREFGDTLFNEVDKDFGQKPFPDAPFLDAHAPFLDSDARLADSDFAGRDSASRDLVGKAPVENNFDLTGIETDYDYDEPTR